MTPAKKRKLVIDALERGPATSDMVAAQSGLSLAVVKQTLFYLRHDGQIHIADKVWRANVYALGAAPAKPNPQVVAAQRQRNAQDRAEQREAQERIREQNANLRAQRQVAKEERKSARKREVIARAERAVQAASERYDDAYDNLRRARARLAALTAPEDEKAPSVVNPDPWLLGWTAPQAAAA